MHLVAPVVRSVVMAPNLKVFRTPIGFHDAYVAATSQKAALDAWGADANLFARGAAERVTDPALMKEPLAAPGTVIKRPRASAEEHFASLSKEESSRKLPQKTSQTVRPKPRPRPSRSALEAAEQALAEQQKKTRAEVSALEEERERIVVEIKRRREQLQRTARKLEQCVEDEREKYESAMERWRTS